MAQADGAGSARNRNKHADTTSTTQTSPDPLVTVGLGLTAFGLAATLVALLPLVTALELPSQLWALSMLTGVGIAILLLALARNGRRRSKAQRRAHRVPDGSTQSR